MKVFQKTWVAVVITLVMIAGAVWIGQSREDTVPNSPGSVGLDTSLSTSRSEGFLLDEANVLSSEEERQINLYNANWLERYDSLIAVAVVPSVSGELGDYAYERAMSWELAAADAVLVVETETGSALLLPGDDYPLTDSQITSYMNTYLYEGVTNGTYASGILNLFQAIDQFYVDQYGLGYLEPSGYSYGTSRVYGLVMLVVILFVIAWVVDSLRFSAYRQRYYGVGTPPVVFRPILFWHGPGYGWYHRRWRRPPPPPPPGGPGGFGGPRPGGGSSSRPGGGFSGFSGPGRGGSFGGSRGGGGFSSGSRGGGFGGGRGGGGFGRGGGFGGGRGGGGFGGGRGGGFGRR